MISGCVMQRLTMRLSDAGLRQRQTKAVYFNHRSPPWLTEDDTRDRSNRLLGACAVRRNDALHMSLAGHGNEISLAAFVVSGAMSTRAQFSRLPRDMNFCESPRHGSKGNAP
jgi:hypothetical protein